MMKIAQSLLSRRPFFSCHSAAQQRNLHFLLAVTLLLFGLSVHAHAQGCTQCLDSTRATPPAVQAAYRHAIYLLGGAGASLFIAGTLLIRRQR